VPIGVGLTVTQRVRLSARDAHAAGGACDGARALELFADVASELLVRLDGDEGRFRRYDAVEFLAPMRPGDVIEATGVVTEVGATTRTMAFEARKVVRHLGSPDAPSAADALAEPVVVCRALGTSIVAAELQRKPRVVLPALAAPLGRGDLASLPEPHAIITPPPHVLVTPPNSELYLTAALALSPGRAGAPAVLGSARDAAAEAARCRDAGASIVELCLSGAAEPSRAHDLLGEAIALIRRETDLLVQVSTDDAAGGGGDARARALAHGPDLVALECGSVNWDGGVRETTRPTMRDLAARIARAGAAVELVCYEAGHVHEALALAAEGAVPPPLALRFVLGTPAPIAATEQVLIFLVSQVPPPASWTVATAAPHQRAMVDLALRSGGHARVGPLGDGDLVSPVYVEGVAPLVRRAADQARAVGREIVEPARARTLRGLGSAA
jgi:3-keto-5-aminohexanoate cleavage enzyme